MGHVGVMGLVGIIGFRVMGAGVKELMTVTGHMRVIIKLEGSMGFMRVRKLIGVIGLIKIMRLMRPSKSI